MLEESESIGCCHDFSINIGGIEVRCPIFVVENCSSNIIAVPILFLDDHRNVLYELLLLTKMMDLIPALLRVTMDVGLRSFVR
jgi:hypothetical protein